MKRKDPNAFAKPTAKQLSAIKRRQTTYLQIDITRAAKKLDNWYSRDGYRRMSLEKYTEWRTQQLRQFIGQNRLQANKFFGVCA